MNQWPIRGQKAPPPSPQGAPSQALAASVGKRGRILTVDVRMAGTGNDNRLDAQDTTRRRLLPLWPDLVVYTKP